VNQAMSVYKGAKDAQGAPEHCLGDEAVERNQGRKHKPLVAQENH